MFLDPITLHFPEKLCEGRVFIYTVIDPETYLTMCNITSDLNNVTFKRYAYLYVSRDGVFTRVEGREIVPYITTNLAETPKKFQTGDSIYVKLSHSARASVYVELTVVKQPLSL